MIEALASFTNEDPEQYEEEVSMRHKVLLRLEGHNHDTLISPETGGMYHPGCPACEADEKLVDVITKPGCTDEEYNEAFSEYRKFLDTVGKTRTDSELDELKSIVKDMYVWAGKLMKLLDV